MLALGPDLSQRQLCVDLYNSGLKAENSMVNAIRKVSKALPRQCFFHWHCCPHSLPHFQGSMGINVDTQLLGVAGSEDYQGRIMPVKFT